MSLSLVHILLPFGPSSSQQRAKKEVKRGSKGRKSESGGLEEGEGKVGWEG
jgi:hypothetical protein